MKNSRRGKNTNLSPNVVRAVMRHLLADNPDGVPLSWLTAELRSMGYNVHNTFSAGALMKQGEGFMMIEDIVYLTEPNHTKRRKRPRKGKQ